MCLMMLKLLRKREFDPLGRLELMRSIVINREVSLSVSLFRDVETKHISGVVSLDLDAAERR